MSKVMKSFICRGCVIPVTGTDHARVRACMYTHNTHKHI